MTGDQPWETPRRPRRGRAATAVVAGCVVLAALAVWALARGDRDGALEVVEAEAGSEPTSPPAPPEPDQRPERDQAAAPATPGFLDRPPPEVQRERPAGSWREIAPAPIPPRAQALGVWTGSEVVVWGGATAEGEPLVDGAAYDPRADRWLTIAEAPRPAVTSYNASALWTGTEMLVLGPEPPLAYRPGTDTWRDLPRVPEHPGQGQWDWSSAGLAGGRVVVTGGAVDGSGEVATVALDVERAAWQRLPPPPVDGWTGPVRTVVAGGRFLALGLVDSRRSPRVAVTAYDAAAGAWTAPEPGPGEAWFPVLLVGGGDGRVVAVGEGERGVGVTHAWSEHAGWHQYPDAPSWLLRGGVPSGHWTLEGLLVWNGSTPRSGGLLPSADPGRGWGEVAEAPLPGRTGHVAVWTGSELVVWSGRADAGELFTDGAALDPTAGFAARVYGAEPAGAGRLDGSWRRLAVAPFTRDNPSLDPAGEGLVLWGGAEGRHTASGAVYEPRRDAWEPIPDAPVAGRQHHATAWTGSELLVWGGHDARGLTDGAAYDPVAGSWRTLPPVPLPGSQRAAGAWSGEDWLVVAGGADAAAAAYDPAADRWRRLPDPPAHGHRHGAVWTGAELLVVSDAVHGAVVRYDPARGDWRAGADRPETMPTDGVEVGWTGEEVLLWGGAIEAPSRAGWAYHPGRDTWRRLPEPWLGGTLQAAGSAWTGQHWVVLGIDEDGRRGLAAYDPAGDRWLALPRPLTSVLVTGPLAWTGREVVAWSMLGDALAFEPRP